MLRQMATARHFNRWMAETVRPFISQDAVLEIGAGIGNLTEQLCQGRKRYLATDTDEGHLQELKARLAPCANLAVRIGDAARSEDWTPLRQSFDTVVCFNVLEHIPDDEAALDNICGVLRPGGKAILLVPQGAGAFGTLDEVLEHQRRYSRGELERKALRAGFHLEQMIPFNRATLPGWILNSRILRRRTLGQWQLKLFDFFVPLLRNIDHFLPWPATSLIAVAVKNPASDAR